MDNLAWIIFVRLAQPHVFAFAAGLAAASRLYVRHPGPSRYAVIGMGLFLGSCLGSCAWDAVSYARLSFYPDGEAHRWNMMLSRYFQSTGYAAGTLSLLAAVYLASTRAVQRPQGTGPSAADLSEATHERHPATPVRAVLALGAPRHPCAEASGAKQ